VKIFCTVFLFKNSLEIVAKILAGLGACLIVLIYHLIVTCVNGGRTEAVEVASSLSSATGQSGEVAVSAGPGPPPLTTQGKKLKQKKLNFYEIKVQKFCGFKIKRHTKLEKKYCKKWNM